MIFKQETIKSWFTGVGSSINNEMVQPFQNANSIISKYNLAIQHNSLTQQEWQRLLAQSDDSSSTLVGVRAATCQYSKAISAFNYTYSIFVCQIHYERNGIVEQLINKRGRFLWGHNHVCRR